MVATLSVGVSNHITDCGDCLASPFFLLPNREAPFDIGDLRVEPLKIAP